ncbi:phosphoglycerate mutase-like protein [Laetiporus sulphureus 93-53]|uniref:Phosphoglycerate mutase-like protein n=1 Tax=Laetiporus sulphureus 93-53 TaxID=1314785 RepID=A0A165F9W7_9APHY|nr:phosphoglycerate mutase-like protein [Laetiporus sulphureus 93-53]KZT08653.1 phosphoglycerate mutase-like protein [Laetiporus sulphureus 93-53]
MSDSSVIGVVLIARHGDRLEHFEDPYTFAVSAATITPLGEQQEWQLGNFLRSTYLDPTSPSYIQGIAPSTSIFNGSQVAVYADNDFPVDDVVMDSAAALVQGLWQPTPLQNITLANGTTITNPLDGYQYVPINGINPDLEFYLEGSTDCTNFLSRASELYNSTLFEEVSEEAAPFFDELPPYVGNRSIELQNAWNIYDYMNVQYVHNATYAASLPPTFLEQARGLANWEQYQVFSDPTFGGIGDIAFTSMIPAVIDSFNAFTNTSNGLLLSYYAVNYRPFLSLFNMTGVVADGSVPEAFVNLAAAVVLELRNSSSSSEPVIRFQFKNGTDDAELHTLPLVFGDWNGTVSGTDVPLSTFVAAFQPVGINNTLEWCQVCGQTTERGCDVALAAASAGVTDSVYLALNSSSSPAAVTIVMAHERITPLAAGFLGAGLTAAVFLLVLAGLLFSWGRGKKDRKVPADAVIHFDDHVREYVDEKQPSF